MSSKERILRTVEHKEVDKVPVSPRIWAWFLECYKECNWETYLKAKKEFDFDPVIGISTGLPDYIHASIIKDNELQIENVSLEQKIVDKGDFWIVNKKFHTPGGILTDEKIVPKPKKEYGISPDPKINEPLIKSKEDLEKIKFLLLDIEKTDYKFIKEISEKVGKEGVIAVRPTIGSDAFVVDSMGLENAMMASRMDKEFLKEVFKLFHSYNLNVAKKCLENGAEVIFDSGFNMSLSAGWSLNDWKEFFKPLVKEMCDLTHSYNAYYFYYDDGKMMKILPELVDIGVDIVETCTPPPIGDFDLKEAKEKFGNKICFKGYVDVVYVIKMGTPEKIREVVKETIEIGAKGGGFILGTTDSIRDGTPLENVRAYFQAGREFGSLMAK